MTVRIQSIIAVTLIALSACGDSDNARAIPADDLMVIDETINVETAEEPTVMPEPATAAAGRAERLRTCSLNDIETKILFDEFVRLEDKLGFSQRDRIEGRIASNNDVTVACVKQTMISALEAGMVPPEPR